VMAVCSCDLRSDDEAVRVGVSARVDCGSLVNANGTYVKEFQAEQPSTTHSTT